MIEQTAEGCIVFADRDEFENRFSNTPDDGGACFCCCIVFGVDGETFLMRFALLCSVASFTNVDDNAIKSFDR